MDRLSAIRDVDLSRTYDIAWPRRGLSATFLIVAGASVSLRTSMTLASLVAVALVALAMTCGRERDTWLAIIPLAGSTPLPWPGPAIAAMLVAFIASTRFRHTFWNCLRKPHRGLARVITSLFFLGAASLPPAFLAAQAELSSTWIYLEHSSVGGQTIVILVVAAAAINSATEELLWRGHILESARTIDGRPATAILVSSASFGASHLNGLPGGMVGIVLAGTFGLLLGWLRHLDGTLWSAFLLHLAVDLTLFSVYASHLVFKQ